MAITKKMCKVVGAITALLGLTVLITSAFYLDKCLELHKLYAPIQHLQTEKTIKHYKLLITVAMVGLFGGVAQGLMGLTMYWGIDTQKSSGSHIRIYLFCTGQATNLMLLITCLTLAIYFKCYLVTRSLNDGNEHTSKYQPGENDGDGQVRELKGAIYCSVLAVDLFIVTFCLLFLGLKLKNVEYHGIH